MFTRTCFLQWRTLPLKPAKADICQLENSINGLDKLHFGRLWALVYVSSCTWCLIWRNFLFLNKSKFDLKLSKSPSKQTKAILYADSSIMNYRNFSMRSSAYKRLYRFFLSIAEFKKKKKDGRHKKSLTTTATTTTASTAYISAITAI